MQLIIDNKQRFRIGQIFADGFDGTVVKEEKKAPEGSKSLSHFQLRPEDMSLAFMYWDFKEELSPETVKTVRCRVFVLKHPKANEEVKVFIAVKYLFPLRVKWYKDDKLQRQLDFKSTTKIKSKIRKGVFISLPKRLIIFKEGNWRTSLNITEKKGDEINKENPPPKDLFLD